MHVTYVGSYFDGARQSPMMRLSAMWSVDRSVDEQGSGSIGDRVLDRWPHDHGSARFVRSSSNFVYVFGRDGAPHFLRFALDSERSRASVEAELDLVEWLGGQGMCVPAVVRSRSGRTIETVETDAGDVHAAVFAAAAGRQRGLSELSPPDFRIWGSALGELHAVLEGYRAGPHSERESWREQLDSMRSLGDDVLILEELEAVRTALQALPVEAANFGLIHGDFELDNVFWDEAISGIIDFEGCRRHWLASDIVFALGASPAFGDRDHEAFLAGYADRHPLDERVLEAAETFVRYRDLDRYATIARALDLPEGPYPDWLEALQTKLERWLSGYRERLLGEQPGPPPGRRKP
jgi:Ser/Thr protein kinase RdoA (MazF antagonist)